MDVLSRWAKYFTEGGLDRGLLVTLETFLAASALTIIWGLIVALVRTSPIRPLRWLAVGYIEIFRGTPLLVQLFTFFAALPLLTSLKFSPFQTATLALTLNTGGYLAESYRAGFQAVPRGQHEAGAALGMPAYLIFWRVTLPQAIRIILPAIGNTVAGLLLTTPFVFLVGLEDMMAKAGQIMNRSADWSVYMLVTLIYTTLGLLLVWLNSWLERRFRPLA